MSKSKKSVTNHVKKIRRSTGVKAAIAVKAKKTAKAPKVVVPPPVVSVVKVTAANWPFARAA